MVKVISLSNEAYKRLKEIKKNRSFSGTVLDLLEGKKKKDILDFFGIWADKDEREIENMKKMIYEDRKKFKTREVNL